MSRGRPITYSAETATAICNRLANGESLRAICADENMPPESTVRQWVIDDREGFAAHYTRARDIGLDTRADRIEERLAAEPDTQRARLMFDHDRWYLSKMAPKRYGEKVTQELVGAGGGPIQNQTIDTSTLTTEQLKVISAIPLAK